MKNSPSSSPSLSDLPPAGWFDDPELDGPEPLTVLVSGRVFGHVCLWGTCHVGITSACVTPPPSRSGYAAFMLGGRRVQGGYERAVGPITLGTSHAPLSMGAEATMRHYEDTGLAIADVAVGEDPHGVWMAGAVRRGISEARVEELRAAKISGDWREMDGSLELVGLLAVNTPGFPVPRPRVRVAASAAGEPVRVSLVASNITPRSERLLAAVAAAQAAYREANEAGEMDALLLRARMPALLARARG